jgi:ABC-type transport system involved in multi-copper enzyme maturation permease subunit
MIRLLKIEFQKLWLNTSSKVLIFIYFGLLLSVALLSVVEVDLGFVQINLGEQEIFNFPYIWHFATYFAAILKFFLLLVIVSMVANEYSNRTLKQNLIDGLSKKEFILSKFLMVLTLALISTILLGIIIFAVGFINSDFTAGSIPFQDMEYLLAYFVKLVGFFSFGLFLGLLIKRSAFAIGFMLLWQIIEGILYALLRWQIFNEETADKIHVFMPLEALANLIKQPFQRLKAVKSLGEMSNTDMRYDYAVHGSEIVIVLVWTVIFIYLSYAILKKRDL